MPDKFRDFNVMIEHLPRERNRFTWCAGCSDVAVSFRNSRFDALFGLVDELGKHLNVDYEPREYVLPWDDQITNDAEYPSPSSASLRVRASVCV
jgi:hypothetical protein